MDFLKRELDLPEKTENEAAGDFDFVEEDDACQDGYSFQAENAYNKFLPYDVRQESQQHFMRIKAMLAKSIQLDQEATHEWFIDLERFVDIYGLAFTKHDHIHLVKLHYELIISTSSMALYYIPYVARSYSRLMKKRHLIHPKDLQLDWRPLYEAYNRLLLSENENLGLKFVPEILESNLCLAIRLSRPYFSPEATQEMLDEWRPLLCPFSVSIQRAMTFMSLFLPTSLPPEHHDKSFKLWFEEVIELWLNGKISSNESKLTVLLARTACDYLGYIDWEPYIPRIFNHLKARLNLNGRQQIRYQEASAFDVQPCIQWITYMISPTNSCLDHISKLFKAIESFYHPSNVDKRWQSKLQMFLYKLPSCYVFRLYRERFKKNSWSKNVPESFRLTDALTTRFVQSLMPVVLTSMFNTTGVCSAALTFRDLAILRPELVVPPLLDRLYGSYETLTEPHRLLASINCMISVIPAMVRPCKYFPEGPSHVIPLLLNSLPGIDSNDMKKCIAVFRFIATIGAHVKMEDFSHLVEERDDLTVEQQQICLSSCQFEDFVVQFLDKCFILIENTATESSTNLDQETHSRNGEEGIIEAAISSVTVNILIRSSLRIRLAALDKIYHHITSHIFDTKTQGRAIAALCLAVANSTPREALGKFIPYLSRLILTLTDNEEVFKDSTLDEELLFSLLLMSELVCCQDLHLLEYKESIVSVLHRSLKLRFKKGYLLGCSTLRHLLRYLTSIGADKSENLNSKSENSTELPFDSWGKTIHIKELDITWHIPTEQKREFAQYLLETFLKTAVNELLAWVDGKIQLDRVCIERNLHIVLSSFVGAASVLPTLKSETIKLCDSHVPFVPMYISDTGTEPLDFKDGTNIRTWVVQSLKKVLKHIKITCEDDTKSCSLICEIFSIAISYFGFNKTEIKLGLQRIKTMKTQYHNKLLGSKRFVRYLLIERVAQQHRMMVLNRGQTNFTKLHLDILNEMFELSQSHYVEVRILAQDTVYLMLAYFPFSENILVPMLVQELRKSSIEHNKLKGLLFLLVGRRGSYSSIMVDPSWNRLLQLWPAVVESPFSEKPSIVRLLDRICSIVHKGFDTFDLTHKFSESVKKFAAEMWTNGCIDISAYEPPSENLLISNIKDTDIRNQKNIEDYEKLVLKMAQLIDDPLIHWHRKLMAFGLFYHLMRDDHPLPIPALKTSVNCMISERFATRLKGAYLVMGQLKLLKRKHAKRSVVFSANSSRTSFNNIDTKHSKDSNNQDKLILSNSNKWLQYKIRDKDYTKEEWNNMIFIDKPHIGFYDWPKDFKVYDTYDKQPVLDRKREDLPERERIIYDFFTNPKFVEKLVDYYCLEDQKGDNSRRFDLKRALLWKSIFRNYGPCMIKPFEKYIHDYTDANCEFKQKFVVEFLAGLMRGSKHWSYEMMQELKSFMLNILEKMTIRQENFTDWIGFANSVFRHRDVRRFDWLLKYLIDKATSPAQSMSPSITPYIQTSRMSLAHYALMQCEWRATDHIFGYVIENLRSQDQLLAYTNIRNCLASIYSLIYMYDDRTLTSRIPGTLDRVPPRVEFIDSLLPKLAILEKTDKSQPLSSKLLDASDLANEEEENFTSDKLSKLSLNGSITNSATEEKSDTDSKTPEQARIDLPTMYSVMQNLDVAQNQTLTACTSSASISSINTNSSNNQQIDGVDRERKEALKLMKLTARWIFYLIYRMRSPVSEDFFKLLPVICEMGRETNDQELYADSVSAIIILGISLLGSKAVTNSLQFVRKIIAHHSWHARVAAAAFLEVMVSSNFFNLLINEQWREEIIDIIINNLITDERIEVRESAASTLSGLIHCEFMKISAENLIKFKHRASAHLVRKKLPNGTIAIDSKSIVIRHSGILCLCACVDAFPYTVPEFLPEILILLSDHITDPQPISTTIKKTMSNFRRTHHDNWQSDKEKFTDDQLSLLADLLVSPSYYA